MKPKYNVHTYHRLILHPGKTGFVAQRLLKMSKDFNPLNAELNPICHPLALLEDHHILHVSRIKVKGLQTALGQKEDCDWDLCA